MKKIETIKIILFFLLISISCKTNTFIIKLIQEINQLTNALDEHNRKNREALVSNIKNLFNQNTKTENIDSNTNINSLKNILRKPFKSISAKQEEGKKSFTFENLAGKVPTDVYEIVDFLRNPEKFKKVGAQMPKGILLVGPPGTGKTSIARAIAGEAEAAFFNASGSQFVELYVGTGPQRIRELFEKARNSTRIGVHKKAIIFIDELDAIGGKRHDFENSEYRNTLNELLNQMDGFNQQDSILVIGATNTPNSLDCALKRPGRFDRIVKIDLPDESNRLKILEFYASNIALDKTQVNLEELAKETAFFSPAELKNLVNEAAVRAARKNEDLVTQKDFKIALKSIRKKNESNQE